MIRLIISLIIEAIVVIILGTACVTMINSDSVFAICVGFIVAFCLVVGAVQIFQHVWKKFKNPEQSEE